MSSFRVALFSLLAVIIVVGVATGQTTQACSPGTVLNGTQCASDTCTTFSHTCTAGLAGGCYRRQSGFYECAWAQEPTNATTCAGVMGAALVATGKNCPSSYLMSSANGHTAISCRQFCHSTTSCTHFTHGYGPGNAGMCQLYSACPEALRVENMASLYLLQDSCALGLHKCPADTQCTNRHGVSLLNYDCVWPPRPNQNTSCALTIGAKLVSPIGQCIGTPLALSKGSVKSCRDFCANTANCKYFSYSFTAGEGGFYGFCWMYANCTIGPPLNPGTDVASYQLIDCTSGLHDCRSNEICVDRKGGTMSYYECVPPLYPTAANTCAASLGLTMVLANGTCGNAPSAHFIYNSNIQQCKNTTLNLGYTTFTMQFSGQFIHRCLVFANCTPTPATTSLYTVVYNIVYNNTWSNTSQCSQQQACMETRNYSACGSSRLGARNTLPSSQICANYTFEPGMGWISGPVSFPHCRHMCALNPKCTNFVYFFYANAAIPSNCGLFSQCTPINKTVIDTSVTYSLIDVQRNYSRLGNCTDQESCQELNKPEKCTSMGSGVGPLSIGPYININTTCDTTFAILNATGVSLTDCRHICAKTATCSLVTFNHGLTSSINCYGFRSCTAKPATGWSSYLIKAAIVPAQMTCPNQGQCLEMNNAEMCNNTDLIGLQLLSNGKICSSTNRIAATLTTTLSLIDCRQMCLSTPTCTHISYFHHFPIYGTCFLFSGCTLTAFSTVNSTAPSSYFVTNTSVYAPILPPIAEIKTNRFSISSAPSMIMSDYNSPTPLWPDCIRQDGSFSVRFRNSDGPQAGKPDRRGFQSKAVSIFAGEPDAGYCMVTDIPGAGSYIYNCNHPNSNLIGSYSPITRVLTISGNVVRCAALAPGSCATEQNSPCKFDIPFTVKEISGGFMLDTGKAGGSGWLNCSTDNLNLRPVPTGKVFKMRNTPGFKGEIGSGWLQMANQSNTGHMVGSLLFGVEGLP